MATDSLDAVSASIPAGLNLAADARPSPFASPFSIAAIAADAGILAAIGVAVLVIAIVAAR